MVLQHGLLCSFLIKFNGWADMDCFNEECRKPKRIQRKRVKGWRMPPNTVSICRPGKFGNPFSIESCIDAGFATDVESARQMCVDTFRDWLENGDKSDWFFLDGVEVRKKILDNLEGLRGKNLACFCKEGEVCHGDVLLEIANK